MADNFTPEQIEQFLQEFFTVVGRRQYIGARYVPIFGRKGEDSIEWDNSAPYEPLTIVLYQGNSYTSRTYVPTGIAITDTTYWANTGNYNAQVEAYRQEVAECAQSITDLTELVDTNTENISTNAENIENITPIVPSNPRSGEMTPEWFLNNGQQNGWNNTRILTYTPENTIKAYGAPNIYNSDIFNSHYDVCAALMLANSYIRHMGDFYYGTSYTAIRYEGTYNDPIASNPKDHKNSQNQMPIDCNALTQLIGHGVPYWNSVYSDSVSENYYLHRMFEPRSPTIKPYWYYGLSNPNPASNTGYGRMITDNFAKMLFDCGRLQSVVKGSAASYPIGTILFLGDQSAHPDRFLGIVHCYMIVGYLGGSSSNKLVLEAVDDDPRAGIAVRPIPQRNREKTIAYYVPPFMNREYMMARREGIYVVSEYNLNINAHALTWSPIQSFEGCRVVTLTPSSNNTEYTLEITLTPQNNFVALPLESQTVTITKKAGHRLYFPYGYDISIEETSGANITFNTCCQCCYSDTELITPPSKIPTA